MVEVSDIFKDTGRLQARAMLLRARTFPPRTVLRAYYLNAYAHTRWISEPENTFRWKQLQKSQDRFDNLTREESHG